MRRRVRNYNKDMSFSDLLAIDRTILSNERTFLAYIRTSLNVLAAGISFIKLFEFQIINILGYVLTPTGVLIFIIGAIKFRKIKKDIYN